jgi:hypothetical protein
MGAREVLTTIHNWMGNLRRAVMANRLKTSALVALAGLLSVSLLIMILEALGHFSGTVRGVLLALWTLAGIGALGLGVVWPVLRYTVFAPDDKALARDYAGRMPAVRDRVLNALQLLEKVDNADREGYSPELILEAGRGVAEDLRPLDPKSLPATDRLRFGKKVAMITGGLAVLLLLFAGRPLLAAASRVMNPGQNYEPPAPFALLLKPGNMHLVRGDSLIVDVTATGTAPASVVIERLEKGKNASEPVTVPGENGSYRYVYRGITSPFVYWAHEGRVKTEEFQVQVQELPGVRFLSLRLTPPSYTGLTEQALEENVGDVATVIGTKVKLQLAATKTLREAHLEFLTPPPLTPPRAEGNSSETVAPVSSEPVSKGTKTLDLDGSKATGEFSVTESGYYRIHLTDQDGLENRDPILYRITARPDEPPMISLIEPSRDLDITANAKLAVRAEAMDDFGFTRMSLRYHRPPMGEPQEEQQDESRYQTIPMTYKTIEPGKAAAEMVWDLTSLDLLPEDQVLFFVEVWDNDAIHGPKRARSEIRTLRYPSMSEMFDKQETETKNQEISLSDLLKESQDLREKVDEAVQEYKSNPEMSWERKQEIEKLLEKQQNMNQMLNQISQAMQQAAQQMQQKSMFSPEVMDKLQKIQEMVQEVITPEMRKALEKLQQAMKQPSEEEMRKALENFQNSQEMFEKMLDQTLNMLQQLKQAKKLDELTRRLDELGRKQDQLNEKMDQNTPENAQKSAQEQNKLSEEMKKIEDEAKKLAEEMKKTESQGQKAMEDVQKKMDQEQLSQEMKKNSGAMSMCQNQSAKKKGKRMRQQMADMANQMQQARQQMQQDENAEVQEKLERVRDQMLDLSMRQEKLWKDSQNLESGSPQLAQAAEEQENLRQALGRVNEDLQELARKTLFVTPQLMAGVFAAQQQMRSAAEAASSRDPRTATYFRQQALGALNAALKESQSACSSCKSSCNKPNPNSMCNKAGQMASQQRKLNQDSQGMMNQNPGSLSMGEQAGMQRLAVEQRSLAKAAKELAEEAKATQQSLGNMKDVAKDMEEVAKDLENRNVDERTMAKQEHIESRLLDFQRAQREREFSPKRQSTPGVDVVRTSPNPLPGRPGRDQLREDLLRALDAQYTPDYEQLIRAYFDALSKWK